MLNALNLRDKQDHHKLISAINEYFWMGLHILDFAKKRLFISKQL